MHKQHVHCWNYDDDALKSTIDFDRRTIVLEVVMAKPMKGMVFNLSLAQGNLLALCGNNHHLDDDDDNYRAAC